MPKTYTPKEIRELRAEAYKAGLEIGRNNIRREWVTSLTSIRDRMSRALPDPKGYVRRGCVSLIESLTTQINESEADNE